MTEHAHGDVTHSHGVDPGRHFHPDPATKDLVRWELAPATGHLNERHVIRHKGHEVALRRLSGPLYEAEVDAEMVGLFHAEDEAIEAALRWAHDR